MPTALFGIAGHFDVSSDCLLSNKDGGIDSKAPVFREYGSRALQQEARPQAAAQKKEGLTPSCNFSTIYRTAARFSVLLADAVLDFCRVASSAALSPCMCLTWILLSFCSFASSWPKLAFGLQPVFRACLLISFTSSSAYRLPWLCSVADAIALAMALPRP
jgi:hypothetical protein